MPEQFETLVPNFGNRTKALKHRAAELWVAPFRS